MYSVFQHAEIEKEFHARIASMIVWSPGKTQTLISRVCHIGYLNCFTFSNKRNVNIKGFRKVGVVIFHQKVIFAQICLHSIQNHENP